MVAVSSTWESEGHCDLGDLIDDQTWADLSEEAHDVRGGATEYGFSNVASHRDGSFSSPSRYAGHRGGPVFQAVLRSRDLLEDVRHRTGLSRLIPVRCGFNYYRQGDYMGLHRDSVKATVTICFGITSNLGSMWWAPELRRTSNDKLGELIAQEGIFPVDAGAAFEVGQRELRAFDGYNVPHWRNPFAHDFGILANLCYFDL